MLPVSVVMTVRNGMPYLPAALESVVQVPSECAPQAVIVVDDGSVDESLSYLNSMAAKYRSISVVSRGAIGRGRALNVGLEHVATEFVAILDADDLSHPKRFCVLVDVLRSNSDAAIVGTGFVALTATSAPPRWMDALGTAHVEDVSEKTFFRNALTHSSMVMRVDAVRRASGYDEALRSQFDRDLQMRLVIAGYRLLRVGEAMVARRIHDNQSFEARNRLRYLTNGAILQHRHLKARGMHIRSVAVPVAYFLYGLLPRSVRRARFGRQGPRSS